MEDEEYNEIPPGCLLCGERGKKMYSIEEGVCIECEEELENQSGYCSLSCRMGCGCDGSC